MPLHFVAPSVLLGLLAAALPWLIHRIGRRRARPVAFPAMELLLRAEREVSARRRLREILLLLLRTLVAAALPLAFARPFAEVRSDLPAATIRSQSAVIVLDDSVEVRQILLRIARFFRDESCGQCVPCRVGTKRQEEVLERILGAHNGGSRESDVSLLSDIAQAMRDASICGLGQTAANAIASGLTQLKVLNG